MSENGDLKAAESADADQVTDPAAVERRVWRNIFAVIAVAVALAALLADLDFMLGLTLGGGLALVNYKWLHASLRAALAAGTEKAPPGTVMKFVFRWVIVGAAVYAASLTGRFNALAILLGLLAPALAVMMEAVYVTYKTIAHGGGR
jgi:ATP synthase I chain